MIVLSAGTLYLLGVGLFVVLLALVLIDERNDRR